FYNHLGFRLAAETLSVADFLFTPVLGYIAWMRGAILVLVPVKRALFTPLLETIVLLAAIDGIGLHLGLLPLRFANTLAANEARHKTFAFP
ncbi:MAG: hypothetical protein ACE5IR_20755, partial [bacterium]